jgi:hypothetical protein
VIRLLLRKLRRLARVLTTDERAAARWLAAASHGAAAFLLATVFTILPFADSGSLTDMLNTVRVWTRSDWLWRAGVGGVFAVRAMMLARAPSLTIDEIHAALAARGAVPGATPPKENP